ncbi:uncharacterized protein LOC111692636, partial [Anoplophora glabripennis]|uniref:uncharacterized protein LOC111692636 n=1 Tax=Anoplophora glabripennis TaxID=217634 RepID=UPI000C75C307
LKDIKQRLLILEAYQFNDYSRITFFITTTLFLCRYELYRQKKVPPTKAYVTLLSLYDLLNKESKRLGLNKYQGYSDAVLQVLIESSKESSAYQLRTVLNKIIERSDTKKPDIVKKIKQLVTDLDEHSSYINNALRYIPALPFVS